MQRIAAPALALGSLVLLAVRRSGRIVVEGDSMRPTLLPGDRLLVVRGQRARPGDLVVTTDPRERSRVVVKRVAAVGPEGLTVHGDNPAASTDSRSFGPLRRVEGRALYRYHPSHRAGRLTARRTVGPWW